MRFGVNRRWRLLLRVVVWCALLLAWSLLTNEACAQTARGGLAHRRYAWGDELRPGGRPVAKWWQGNFPERDTGEDGFRGRAPAGSFPPNGFGLYDVAGNVLEP